MTANAAGAGLAGLGGERMDALVVTTGFVSMTVTAGCLGRTEIQRLDLVRIPILSVASSAIGGFLRSGSKSLPVKAALEGFAGFVVAARAVNLLIVGKMRGILEVGGLGMAVGAGEVFVHAGAEGSRTDAHGLAGGSLE